MLALPYPQLEKSLAQAYERHSRWLIVTTRALLVVAVAGAAARLIWALMPVPEAARWRPAPVQVRAAATNAAPAGIDSIVAARLFGLYQPNPLAMKLSAAPETRLNLTLLGIFAGTLKSESRALIGQQGGEEKPYSIGDDVAAGVTLQAIFPDRVILSRGGQLETLRLDKEAPGSGFVSSGTGAGTLDGAVATQLAQVRQEVLQDPNKAAEYIRVQPASVGGQMRGYRVYPGHNQALFSDAGLRPGDLVTSVNGVELNDTQKALQMLNDLSKASSVSVVVERGGQLQTINVSFN